MLSRQLGDFFTLSISVLLESLPFVFLGTLLSIVVQIWLPPAMLNRLLPRPPMLRRAILSLLGMLVPVCECGNVPLARGLMMRTLSVPEATTFLLAAPLLNPVTIITTYQAFGWEHGILAARILGGFFIANLAAWVLSKHPREHEMLTTSFAASCRRSTEHDERHDERHEHEHEHEHEHSWGAQALRTRIHSSLKTFTTETSTLLPALTVGSAIAGAIQVGVPREMLITLGSHPLWSVLALIALAFIISICSNVDAFFVLSLSSTFMPGGIAAFLIFGAMMDIKMIALLRTTFTKSTIIRLATLVTLSSLTIGWGLNLVA